MVITSTLDAAYNPGTGAIGTTGSSTLQLRGNNTTAKAITFANSTDTPYIVNVGHKAVTPQGDYTIGNAQTTNSQGVALKIQGDQQAFINCKFLGYQDTLYVDGGRAYFKDSYVTGDIDFIFGQGTGVFDNSTINIGGDHVGGTITAARTDKRTSNGIVFLEQHGYRRFGEGQPGHRSVQRGQRDRTRGQQHVARPPLGLAATGRRRQHRVHQHEDGRLAPRGGLAQLERQRAERRQRQERRQPGQR